jgi:hypothetical protein
MEARKQRANQLRELKKELASYLGQSVKDLPPELQKKIHTEQMIQPITTSGLEHIDNVMVRLNWGIFYLTDPAFPRKKEQPKPQAAPPQPQKPGQTPPHLDFGPFNPQSGNHHG